LKKNNEFISWEFCCEACQILPGLHKPPDPAIVQILPGLQRILPHSFFKAWVSQGILADRGQDSQM
jgi:hypothetical protein